MRLTCLPSKSRNEGQAMVEAAMTMLMFFVFLFAIFEAGRFIQVRQALTDAAREGARRSVAPMTRTLPGDLPNAADVQGIVQSYLNAASIYVGTCSPPCPCSSGICVNQTLDIGGITYTKVTVSYPYQIMTLVMFGDLNMTLTGQSLMRNETSAK